MSEQTAQEQATPKGAASVLDAGLGIVVTLRKQSEEIAKSGLPGWGNTMTEAADEIEALRYSLRLDEELIGMIQKIISSLNSRPMPNDELTGARRASVLDDGLGFAGHDEADDWCDVPPLGWRCTRAKGHTGPCAAVACHDDVALVARGMTRLREAPNAGIQRASPASGEAPLE